MRRDTARWPFPGAVISTTVAEDNRPAFADAVRVGRVVAEDVGVAPANDRHELHDDVLGYDDRAVGERHRPAVLRQRPPVSGVVVMERDVRRAVERHCHVVVYGDPTDRLGTEAKTDIAHPDTTPGLGVDQSAGARIEVERLGPTTSQRVGPGVALL